MIQVANSIEIARAPKDVFAFVSDLTNESKFHSDVLKATKTSEGPIGPGTTFDYQIKPTMGLDAGTARVLSLDLGRSILFSVEMSKMTAQRAFRFDPTATGTKVTHEITIQPRGMMRLMSFMMRRMISKSWDGFLGNLKRILEA